MSQGMRIVNTPTKGILRKLHTLTVQQSQQGVEVKILVGAGPRRETFARDVDRKRAELEDLKLLLKVLQTRHGNIQVHYDQEECLREFVHSAAGRLELPKGVTVVEQSQANTRAEQRVRELRERLQMMVEDAKRRNVETIRRMDPELPCGE